MKKKKLLFLFIIILIIGTILFIAIKNFSNNKGNSEQEFNELKEQKIKLQAEKNEVFYQDGFSEEYYRIDQELTDINEKIQHTELSTSAPSIIFTISGILFIIIFGSAVVLIFKTISSHKIIQNSTQNSNTSNLENMAKIIGNMAVDMAKEMNPEYKSLKCPNCGAALTDNLDECEYCHAPLIKVVATKK